MFSRAFKVAGLLVRLAEWKVYLIGFAARRSAIAMLGYTFAAIVAFGGLIILLAAGYVALEAIIGVSAALAAVGVFLLIVASITWVISNRNGKSTGEAMSEDETQRKATRDEQQLRTLLGMSNDADTPANHRPGPTPRPSHQPQTTEALDDPKVVLAAGFALLGLLGPGRIFRTVRIATTIGSVAALANRAISEHREKQSTQIAP